VQRQSVRYAIHHPVEVGVANERHHVHSQDLSRTGMFLPITSPFEVGTIVKLAMPVEQRRVYTRGTIVRTDSAGVGIALREPCEPADELFSLGIEQLVRRCAATQLVRPANQPAALSGDLSMIQLPAILTMLEHERQTGRLVLTGEHVMWIDLCEGRIVDAGMADVFEQPYACVMSALDMRRGRFELVPCEPESALGLMPITHLLLEHARKCDESGRRRITRASA